MAIKLITTDLDMSLNGKCRDQLQENFAKIEDSINKINNQVDESEQQKLNKNAVNITKIIEILAEYDVPIGLDDKGNVIKID